MLTITRAEIIEHVCMTHTGIPQGEAKQIVEDMIEMYKNLLVAGHTVAIRKAGKLWMNQKSARPVRNPKNGDDFIMPARKTVTLIKAGAAKGATFCPSKQMEYLADLGHPYAVAEDLIKEFHKMVLGTSSGEYRIELRSLGTFYQRVLPAGRKCRNPMTGEPVIAKEKHLVHFRIGRGLLRLLNPEQEFGDDRYKKS